MHRFSTALATMLVAALVGLLPIATPRAVATTPPPSPAPPATNDFIPTDQNLSDCIGTLQRPGCGSERKGDWHTLLVFAVLVAGLAFIGWRIVAGLRAPQRPAAPPSAAASSPDSVSPHEASGGSAR